MSDTAGLPYSSTILWMAPAGIMHACMGWMPSVSDEAKCMVTCVTQVYILASAFKFPGN